MADQAHTPIRVQLSRKKGWRMPPNTVKVDRTSGWGNPYKAGDFIARGPYAGSTVRDVMHSVVLFREWALAALRGDGMDGITADEAQDALSELRGKNLACWCKPGEPCHADVLLELANAPIARLQGKAA